MEFTTEKVARMLLRGGFNFDYQRGIYYEKSLVGEVALIMEIDDGDVPSLNLLVIDKNFQS